MIPVGQSPEAESRRKMYTHARVARVFPTSSDAILACFCLSSDIPPMNSCSDQLLLIVVGSLLRLTAFLTLN
jgi:hypothetical protein